MKTKIAITLISLCMSISRFSQNKNAKSDSKMNSFIDALMKKMTLEEKIGQMNLPSVGFDTTGPILSKVCKCKN